MTLEQQWIEYDYNPFILFNAQGKIVTLNAEAQFLLGSTTAGELFDLAKTYASINFGFKTTFVELEYGRYKFFGLTVGYEDEEQIGIKLYQAPTYKLNTTKPNGELTNIFTIIDLCIATNSINSDIVFKKDYDPTIPDVIIDSNKLIKLLNKIYEYFKENETIRTRVFFRIGEHIKFEDKKYSIFSISVESQSGDSMKREELDILAKSNNFYIDISDTKVTINLPMITS
jgi:nitrogen-specific signal transduction histidine kinase